MNRQETGIIMDILATAYPRFYAGKDAPDPARAVALWSEMFAHDDVALVAAAVKALIASDDKGFPPHVGAVKAKLRQLTGQAYPEFSEAEAWSKISKAVRNGIYGAKEEYDKLPPTLRRIVGSPAQLREWAMLDSETLHSVVASNVQRSFRAISTQEQETAKLPKDVRAQILKLAEKQEEHVNAEALTPKYVSEDEALRALEANRRSGWERARQQEDIARRKTEEVIAKLRGVEA